jgi:ABC-2 type transport system ATP-binding protein
MEEADELCDRVAIIDHGKILVEDTPAALKARSARRRSTSSTCAARRTFPPSNQSSEALRRHQRRARRPKASASLRTAPMACSPTSSRRNPYGLRDLTITETSLETVFIRLTGRDLRE